MKRTSLLLVALLGAALAADKNERILQMESKSFTGDLRNGPYIFTGSPQNPVKATVSTLKISAPRAVLSAPSGTPITSAEGKREADFSGDVTVTRGRLTAKGPTLDYSELNGVGVLKGSPSATFAPDKKTDDPVTISAGQMSLDVDTDVSTSTGNVNLQSGTQNGKSDALTFDEKRELARLTGNLQMSRAPSGRQKALTITGQEARLLTKSKLMYVNGQVKLTSGDTTTTGDAMYYNDAKNLAVIVGNAVSMNAKDGTRVTGNVLEQRTDLGRVRQLTGGYTIPVDQFKLSTEK